MYGSGSEVVDPAYERKIGARRNTHRESAREGMTDSVDAFTPVLTEVEREKGEEK